MATIVGVPKVEVSATMQFNEIELRALDALVGYGADAFLAVFYEKLGKAYLQPHEAGLRELFESVRSKVPGVLGRAEDARRVFTGERRAVQPDMPDRLKNASVEIIELKEKLDEALKESAGLAEDLEDLKVKYAQLEGRMAEVRDAGAALEGGAQ